MRYSINNYRKGESMSKLKYLIIIAVVTMLFCEIVTIEVSNTVFTPDYVDITVGDTVRWINVQGSHNVNGARERFPQNPESFGNDIGQGWTYDYTFTKIGTYDYICDPHANLGMLGKIQVKDSVPIEKSRIEEDSSPYSLVVKSKFLQFDYVGSQDDIVLQVHSSKGQLLSKYTMLKGKGEIDLTTYASAIYIIKAFKGEERLFAKALQVLN